MSSARGNTGVFGYVGRRLALLNAAAVVLLIMIVGLGMVGIARHSLARSADHALRDQAEVAQDEWSPSLAAGVPIVAPVKPADSESGTDAEHEDEADELFESGDALPLGFDRDGNLVANPRGLITNALPDESLVQRALGGESTYRSLSIREEPTVRVYTMPLLADGEIVGAVQVVRGQTQLESAMHSIELAALVGALIGALGAIPTGLFLAKRAMRPIDRAFQRQQSFIADASHELRTPLAVARANTELVRRIPDAPASERDLELSGVIEEIDRMARLVDNMLILAKADADRLVLQAELMDLSTVVKRAANPMAAIASAGGQQFTVKADAELIVKGDEDRIAQVVRIVLGNAIAYSHSGDSIAVSTLREGDDAVITIQDTGVGISTEEQRFIFERFYRGDRSRSRESGGSGLGLSIAQAIVEAHKGSIALESEVGTGTTVRVRLPLVIAT